MMNFAQISALANELDCRSLSANSRKSYLTYINIYKKLIESIPNAPSPFPITIATIKVSLYVYRYENKVQFNTLKNLLSAISFYFRENNYPNLTLEPEIIRHVKALKNEMKQGNPPFRKDPILVQDLQKMTELINLENFYDVRFMVLCSFSFFGFLRFSEVKKLTKSDISIDVNGNLKILVRYSKTDQEGYTTPVYIAPGPQSYHPLIWYEFYLPFLDPDQDVLFTGNDLSYYKLLKSVCKKLEINDRQISFHSFRRGGAHQASLQKAPDSIIKKHGRWLSDIYHIYTAVEMKDAGEFLTSNL